MGCRTNAKIAFSLALATLLPLDLATAQRGDKKGETQVSRIPKELIPPAPPLSPDAAVRRFKLRPGFRVELFASEPMIESPVAAQFDADGRLWVVEMRGYMRNLDGGGEDTPVGRVSILENTDEAGCADKCVVFLEGLIMPRALLHVRGGVLIAEPPNLWFYPIEHDKPGPRVAVATDFGSRQNPEHTANSLVLAMDNWIYSLYHPWRYRFIDGKWQREPMPQRAQWGMAQDDFGRLFYSLNADHLRGDLVPSHYFAGWQRAPGIGVQIAKDQTVWPARMNPGVNRGYQPKTLRPDGTLEKFTAACGACIYRGEALPGCAGNAFVCDPAANLIHRDILSEQAGAISAHNAYEKNEFLASSDELFRPVNLYNGPDGALYVVDMYHGIIQHRMFVTSYLRSQIEERGLDKVLDKGRIWRVAGTRASSRNERPRLSEASPAQLVAMLSHANGWWRDTAQRLLVERADASVATALRAVASRGTNDVPRLHALWTLEGIGQLEPEDIRSALASSNPRLRAAAIRLSEPMLRAGGTAAGDLCERIFKLAADPAAEVQMQLALTLGLLKSEPKATNLLASIAKNSHVPLARDLAAFALPAKPPSKPLPPVVNAAPLSTDEQKRFDAGKGIYEQVCLACHQQHGLGQPGLAPPLVGSEWVAGSEKRMIRIVLQGMRGKLKVKGEEFELDMPSLGVLDDEQVASVLTYVRREWNHGFPAVSPESVQQVRKDTENREEAWTMGELLKVP
jgi:mono/diheme cytochrome c family protein/glucose/arabinose dehydrogenase